MSGTSRLPPPVEEKLRDMESHFKDSTMQQLDAHLKQGVENFLKTGTALFADNSGVRKDLVDITSSSCLDLNDFPKMLFHDEDTPCNSIFSLARVLTHDNMRSVMVVNGRVANAGFVRAAIVLALCGRQTFKRYHTVAEKNCDEEQVRSVVWNGRMGLANADLIRHTPVEFYSMWADAEKGAQTPKGQRATQAQVLKFAMEVRRFQFSKYCHPTSQRTSEWAAGARMLAVKGFKETLFVTFNRFGLVGSPFADCRKLAEVFSTMTQLAKVDQVPDFFEWVCNSGMDLSQIKRGGLQLKDWAVYFLRRGEHTDEIRRAWTAEEPDAAQATLSLDSLALGKAIKQSDTTSGTVERAASLLQQFEKGDQLPRLCSHMQRTKETQSLVFQVFRENIQKWADMKVQKRQEEQARKDEQERIAKEEEALRQERDEKNALQKEEVEALKKAQAQQEADSVAAEKARVEAEEAAKKKRDEWLERDPLGKRAEELCDERVTFVVIPTDYAIEDIEGALRDHDVRASRSFGIIDANMMSLKSSTPVQPGAPILDAEAEKFFLAAAKYSEAFQGSLIMPGHSVKYQAKRNQASKGFFNIAVKYTVQPDNAGREYDAGDAPRYQPAHLRIRPPKRPKRPSKKAKSEEQGAEADAEDPDAGEADDGQQDEDGGSDVEFAESISKRVLKDVNKHLRGGLLPVPIASCKEPGHLEIPPLEVLVSYNYPHAKAALAEEETATRTRYIDPEHLVPQPQGGAIDEQEDEQEEAQEESQPDKGKGKGKAKTKKKRQGPRFQPPKGSPFLGHPNLEFYGQQLSAILEAYGVALDVVLFRACPAACAAFASRHRKTKIIGAPLF
ncbi:unnamed protein product [Amoebophrya sp. A25]|nr:unnamed protein product [Amoebophrya sp. A25]|eukprot:GSA25T00009450001.1